MKKLWIVIGLVTLFVVVNYAAPYIGFSHNAIIGMFILTPFLVIFMAYIILKYGKPSAHTFDEKWYEDM